jgi:starch phosphorylase
VANHHVIAYFTMEIAIEPGMPTYSGGLGVLAGDTIFSAADHKLPMVAVSLLHRKGYFHQRLKPDGTQVEEPVAWQVDDFLTEHPERVAVDIEGRTVAIRCWEYGVTGRGGHNVPVYFLDTDLPENGDWDRTLTHYLYGGDSHYRLCQEVVLGVGGVRMLRALGHRNVQRFHMNEGHASLLTLELLDERLRRTGRWVAGPEDVEEVREQCVFTTHTPVAAGHDKFPMDLAKRVLGKHGAFDQRDVFSSDNVLNMTYVALSLSHYVNGVAKRHGEVSRDMFAGYHIDSITNGVHAGRWTSEPFQTLFDRYIPGWREDNFSLRYALNVPRHEVWTAHREAKKALLEYVNHETNAGMDLDYLTLGFARRAATYKRADLLFTDPERLRRMAEEIGPIQVIYAGKAHPRDQEGKQLIKRIIQASQAMESPVRITYLENYDMQLGKLLTAGCDVWLNTPRPPLEASGTSGMKAALNGVPSLSILDGWWIEGCIEGVTGWAIGEEGEEAASEAADRSKDADSLYEKLEQAVLPAYYERQEAFIDIMRHAIALNGSFFNTQRMIQQYVLNAYFR